MVQEVPKTSLLQWRHRRRHGSSVATGGGKGKMVDVWAHNMEAELEAIRSVVVYPMIVAVTASPDIAADRVPGPYASFPAFSSYIRGVQFVEVTLTLLSCTNNTKKKKNSRRRSWRFHLGDFDADHHRFFVEIGVEAPAARRASANRLGAALMTFGMIHNPKVAWFTYDGAADMALLVRCGFTAHLPPLERYQMLAQLKAFFPAMYDLKRILLEEEIIHQEEALSPEEAVMLAGRLLLRDPTSAARLEGYRGMHFGFDDQPIGATTWNNVYGLGDPKLVERLETYRWSLLLSGNHELGRPPIPSLHLPWFHPPLYHW